MDSMTRKDILGGLVFTAFFALNILFASSAASWRFYCSLALNLSLLLYFIIHAAHDIGAQNVIRRSYAVYDWNRQLADDEQTRQVSGDPTDDKVN
jgi:hypothetical protein